MAHSREEKELAVFRLLINKYDYAKTAEQTGISMASLRRWQKELPKLTTPEVLERTINSILANVPEKWTGRDWAIAIGILMDKYLLLKGQPTSRVESIMSALENMPPEELSELEKQFVDAATGSDPNKD